MIRLMQLKTGKGEVWKIMNQKKKKRKRKYMESTKEIDRIVSSKTTRSTLNTLLINGNKKTPIVLSRKTFLVQNTCPFDAVSVLIAIAYTDIPLYKQFIDKIKNDFLNILQKPCSKWTKYKYL